MKHLLAIFVFCIWIISCKKDVVFTGVKNGYMQKVQTALKDSMHTDIAKLDFASAIQSTISKNTRYLRIPYKGIILQQKFVLLQIDSLDNISKGRIVSLETSKSLRTKGDAFNGMVTLYDLKGVLTLESEIINGYVVSFHQKPPLLKTSMKRNSTEAVMSHGATAYKVMPDVLVIGYRESGGGISYSDWINLQSLVSGGGGGGGGSSSGGSTGGYYSSADGNGSNNSNDYYDRTKREKEDKDYIKEDSPILIDFENQGTNPAIDIEGYLKCFASIPDAGSVCSIEIFSDIPVDKDPNKLFNWETESPGHTFLQIKKSNGNQSIIQNIGFYPKTNWKAILTTAPTEGKFVDNGDHEFNASFKMNITPTQLQSALTHILYLARFINYDIDEYNCTDFALEVFNYIRHPANQLKILRYNIPGGMAPQGTNTPQGLYNKLKSMKQSAAIEAFDVSTPGHKGWVADSNGPCN